MKFTGQLFVPGSKVPNQCSNPGLKQFNGKTMTGFRFPQQCSQGYKTSPYPP